MGLFSPANENTSRWRNFLFFQALFWGLFLLLRASASARYYPDLFWPFMGPRIGLVLVYVLATTGIHLALQRLAWRPIQKMAVGVALCGAILFPLHLLEEGLAGLYAPPNYPSEQFLDYVSSFGWVLMMWTGYYFALDYAAAMRRQADALARAQAQATSAQLKMLRYQLNPHFLFNSLNAVSTLVLERRNAEAEGMILRLSRFLRHLIDTDPEHLSTLKDEVALQRLYLEIEAERFGERMQVTCEVPEELYDCLVPSLLIQPAIENAIKHGIGQSVGEGRLRIACAQRGDRLITIVEDNGPGPPPAVTGAGLGLRNTRARLHALYGDNASVTLTARPEGGARVTFDMPIQRAAQVKSRVSALR